MAKGYYWTQGLSDLFGSNTDPPTEILPVTHEALAVPAPFHSDDRLVRSEIGCSVSLVASHNTSVPAVGWQAGGWACFLADVFDASATAWPDPSNPGVNRGQSSGWLVPQFQVTGTSNELGGFVCSTNGIVTSKGERAGLPPGLTLPELRISIAYGWPFFLTHTPDQWTWSVTVYARALWLSSGP